MFELKIYFPKSSHILILNLFTAVEVLGESRLVCIVYCVTVSRLMSKGLMVGFYGVDRTVEMSTNFLSSFHNNQRRCLLVPLPHFKKGLC